MRTQWGHTYIGKLLLFVFVEINIEYLHSIPITFTIFAFSILFATKFFPFFIPLSLQYLSIFLITIYSSYVFSQFTHKYLGIQPHLLYLNTRLEKLKNRELNVKRTIKRKTHQLLFPRKQTNKKKGYKR